MIDYLFELCLGFSNGNVHSCLLFRLQKFMHSRR